MNHAVDRFFERERDKVRLRHRAEASDGIERDIGLSRRMKNEMPVFLTLRDAEGEPLATAMLPPRGEPSPTFESIIVGPANTDPFLTVALSIQALAEHYGLPLSRDRCYPYRRPPGGLPLGPG